MLITKLKITKNGKISKKKIKNVIFVSIIKSYTLSCCVESSITTLSRLHRKMAVRGPSPRDGKICWEDLTQETIWPGSHLVSAMVAQGQMANAIEEGKRKDFEDAAKDFVVDTVRAKFDPDNGVELQLFDPENEFRLSIDEVLDLVRDCFYRPPSNLRIRVSRVRFGFEVTCFLTPIP